MRLNGVMHTAESDTAESDCSEVNLRQFSNSDSTVSYIPRSQTSHYQRVQMVLNYKMKLAQKSRDTVPLRSFFSVMNESVSGVVVYGYYFYTLIFTHVGGEISETDSHLP